MPSALFADLRERVVLAIEAGASRRELAHIVRRLTVPTAQGASGVTCWPRASCAVCTALSGLSARMPSGPRPRQRGLPKDEGERATASPNLLDRRLAANAPNRKWLADATYIWTTEGWLYVAAVINLFSRRVVGWTMQTA